MGQPACSVLRAGVFCQMEVTDLDPDPRAEGSGGEGPCFPGSGEGSPGKEHVVLQYPVGFDPYG